jgi:hypothetical protein
VTEIATTTTPFAPRTLTVARPGQLAGNDHFDRMGRWLELFVATEQVANVLARTAFVPEPMRGQPENIAAAMMKSLELGIDPLDGLSCIHVVKGKIGFSAEFMRRRIIEAGHEIVIDEATDSRCKIRGRRAGSSEWQTVTFTEEQARKAKISLGDYPADKLVARASSRLCRRVFPDVLAGTTIVDDIEDDAVIIDEAPAVQRRRQPRKVTAQPAAPPPMAAVVDDLLDDVQPAAEGMQPDIGAPEQPDLLDDEPDPPITSPQLQKLSILRKREGYADDDKGRSDWFAWVEMTIGRAVTTNKDLTQAEAGVLIDVLENPGPQDDPQ